MSGAKVPASEENLCGVESGPFAVHSGGQHHDVGGEGNTYHPVHCRRGQTSPVSEIARFPPHPY